MPRAHLGWVGVSNLTLPSSGLLPCHQPRESSHLGRPSYVEPQSLTMGGVHTWLANAGSRKVRNQADVGVVSDRALCELTFPREAHGFAIERFRVSLPEPHHRGVAWIP